MLYINLSYLLYIDAYIPLKNIRSYLIYFIEFCYRQPSQQFLIVKFNLTPNSHNTYVVRKPGSCRRNPAVIGTYSVWKRMQMY